MKTLFSPAIGENSLVEGLIYLFRHRNDVMVTGQVEVGREALQVTPIPRPCRVVRRDQETCHVTDACDPSGVLTSLR